MEQYKMVAENPLSTVVSDYEIKYRSASQYQSEAEMEREFIEQLTTQAYEYLPITSEKELIENLRQEIERLNNYRFSDREWATFFKEKIANPNYGIVEKTTIIQEDHIQLLTRDDGTVKNIYLIDKEHIHNNNLQVINQYVPEGGNYENRYDVTILVNGLPLVHVELKRRGVSIKEAFNQIARYNRDSFWAGSGLFEYAQIFVISNGTQTKYYSNTTRLSHISEVNKQNKQKSKNQTSNSFEFTSYWALRDNKVVADLVDFTATFLSKHTILSILTRYCVLTSEKLLLVMRPYQIAATESILQQIRISSTYKKYGTTEGGGYVWHTTGSGKTLTSFKTARLASQMKDIDKVLFVVDRKDLDYQTMKEYDRFEKGAANSNSNTSVLKKQLENPDTRIIITTIQKLSVFIKKNSTHDIYNRRIVMIFDECHRSQFGEMHTTIVKKFKKYHLFGFTGTPIFGNNTSSGSKPDLMTTDQTFGKRLHIYTIVDAIADGNVLPFRIDYISTMREQENIKDERVYNIDREKALQSPERISRITSYILEHFDNKTFRNTYYKVKDRRLNGFNSIFAVSSIDAAKLYYREFQRQMQNLIPDKRLKIATIFSFGANDPESDTIDENPESTEGLDKNHRDFLESAIADYNEMFATNYDTSAEKFQNYYKDVSLRMKNREIDLLIVVNMFLTGFDATTLNTLWVDKNLRMHGLLQAFSRTNRILNAVKCFGNIICFRNLEEATNESIQAFGNKNAGGLVLLKTFDEYYYGYDESNGKYHPGYKELVEILLNEFPLNIRIIGEDSEKKFIKLYGAILRASNILSVFDQFEGKRILSAREVQDYHSIYIDLYDKLRTQQNGDKKNVNDDIIFEMELIKQVEINIDYILYLIGQLNGDESLDREIVISIQKAISASPDMRNKKKLIEDFIGQLTPNKNINDDWQAYIKEQKSKQLNEIIATEHLKPEETFKFVNQSFKDGYIQESGTGIVKILPPMSIFDKNREIKKKSVIEKLKAFFDRFYSLSKGEF